MGSAPPEGWAGDARAGISSQIAEASKREYVGEEAATVILDSLLETLSSYGYNAELPPREAESTVRRQIEVLLDKSSLHREYQFHRRRFFPWSLGPPVETPEKLCRSLILGMAGPPRDENRSTLLRILRGVRWPVSPEAVTSSRFPWAESLHPAMLESMVAGQAQSDYPLPLGYWPEPLLASATAFAKGPDGIFEVLGWINISRLIYGYGWRVLVDWRYLESVKDHPSFVQFLREEDAMVEEIESAFDRGEYTL